MDWEVIAPMIVTLTLIVTVGGVILLRPITKRLGDLIEIMTLERRDPRVLEGLDGVRELLEHQGSRLDLLERRLDFTESLLSEGRAPSLPSAEEPRSSPE